MGKWLDLAAKLEAEGGERDNRDNRDNSLPNVPNVPNVPGDLPQSLRAGIAKLRTMAAPRITRPEVWPTVVADAVRLASNGRAAQALALGWSPLDLFGCRPGSDDDEQGLAVWLNGRRVLLLDAASCIVQTGPDGRSIFNRRASEGAVLLWDL